MPGGRPRIAIDWEEVLSGPASTEDEVCFASPSQAPRAGGESSSGDERRRGAASASRPHRMFRGLRGDLGQRRPVTRAAAKAAEDSRRGGSTAADNVFAFSPEDEHGERMARKYCSKSSALSATKKNYRQLDVKTRSPRHGRQTKPITVDKMYSAKPCSTTSSPKQQSKKQRSGSFSEWRKEHLLDSSSFCFQKVQDVVLLDDEDMQHEEEVNCGMPDKRNESRIYYPTRDDPEAVELRSSDIKCLDPGVYLSSPVINYYIQYIKRTRLHSEDCRDKFYIFNTYFYGKLEEELSRPSEFSKLRRWWKGVNLFHRGYIILPIHGMSHWSLIIICIPAKESISGPIILHLDSLEMHPSADIFDTVQRYLVEEWCHVKLNPPPDTSISEMIWADLPKNIHTKKVQVPQQKNEYDCGIFMLYYIKQFIREAPERFTKDKLDMFSRRWFKSEDASNLRQRIRKLLLQEFQSDRLDNAMSDGAASDSSSIEDSRTGGELEAAAPCDSSEMVIEGVESGDSGKGNDEIEDAASGEEVSGECVDSGKSNEGIKVAASEEASGESGYLGKRKRHIADVAALDEAPTSSCKRDEEIAVCALSEEAIFADSMKDEEDNVNVESNSSKMENEELFMILSQDRSKSEDVIHSTPIPDVVCDGCDSGPEVEIISVKKQGADNFF